MDMRNDLEDAARRAGVSADDFRLVRTPRHAQVLTGIAERFTTLGSAALQRAWWWEHLRPPVLSRPLADAQRHLRALLPDDERVWFLAEGDRHDWLCEASRDRLPDVLGEMPAFEYSVCSKKLEWLVAHNHHDVVFASGERAVERLGGLPF